MTVGERDQLGAPSKRLALTHSRRLSKSSFGLRRLIETTRDSRHMTVPPEHLHDMRFPGESHDYRRAREALLRAEKDVRDRTEAVARQRRELPLGGVTPTDDPKAPIEHFRAHAHGRGWADIRLLSTGESTFNRDYGAEDEQDRQWPIATVFVRRQGRIHHWWSSEPVWASHGEGEESGHVDFMWPDWNILDCTPEGRPNDNTPRLEYR